MQAHTLGIFVTSANIISSITFLIYIAVIYRVDITDA